MSEQPDDLIAPDGWKEEDDFAHIDDVDEIPGADWPAGEGGDDAAHDDPDPIDEQENTDG